MKFTSKLLLTWISIFLAFYIVVIAIMESFFNVQRNVFHLLLVFFVAGVVPPLIITTFYHKKLDYMESEDINPPAFPGQKKAVLTVKPRISNTFDDVWQRIDRQWIVSYSDRENKIIKFRTDSRVFSWGICGYVKVKGKDEVAVTLYPIHEKSRREEKIMNQTLRLLQSVLNP